MSKQNAKDVVLTIRIPATLAERLFALRESISQEREFALKSRLTRSDVVRYLLLRGIELMEQEYDLPANSTDNEPPPAFAGE